MEALEAVVKGLNDAVVALKNMTAKAARAISDAEILAAEAKAMVAKVEEARKDVELREKAVAGKEGALLSGEDLAAERDKVEAALAALSNDRQAFNRFCSERKAFFDQEAANLKDAQSALDAAWAELEAEKKEYKVKILEEITKKVGK
jgi:hypothetical protein